MKIAILGAGIVGSSAAYYLSQNENVTIDLYDDDTHGGTKAAVGIVCPWIVQRRNKAWYALVEAGANFYLKLFEDLEDASFANRSGAIIVNEKRHDHLLAMAIERQKRNPIMGMVKEIRDTDKLPSSFKFEKAFEISGAFRVDGQKLLNVLHRKLKNTNFIHETTTLSNLMSKNYDKIIVCAGGRFNEAFDLEGYDVDQFPQKGMLLSYPYEANQYAMAIPKGEIDFLFNHDELVIGASHKIDFTHMDYEADVAQDLIDQATYYMPLPKVEYTTRIGLRSNNKLNLPFYGKLEPFDDIYITGGLGSSGLSSGPIIGYRLAQHILEDSVLDNRYDPKQFVSLKNPTP